MALWLSLASWVLISSLPGRMVLPVTLKRYTPALPFTGALQNLPLAVAAMAPLRAGSVEPVTVTNTGAANVTWLIAVTVAPLALASLTDFTPLTFSISISAFLSFITSALTMSIT